MGYGLSRELAKKRIGDGTGIASEIRDPLLMQVHFNRNGTRICECCQIEGIRQYTRVRQFLFEGKSYLIICDSTHLRTMRTGPEGKSGAFGLATGVFSPENLETARIFEIDRTKLDRSDLSRGQKLLDGDARYSVVQGLVTNQGELLTIALLEEIGGGKVQGYYLGDESHPEPKGGQVFCVVS